MDDENLVGIRDDVGKCVDRAGWIGEEASPAEFSVAVISFDPNSRARRSSSRRTSEDLLTKVVFCPTRHRDEQEKENAKLSAQSARN